MKRILFYIGILFCTSGCFDIPEEGTISDHMGFSMREVPVYLKTQQIIGEGYGLKVTAGETTFPFHFDIEKVTRIDEEGNFTEDVTHLFKQKVNIRKWKEAFTGKEKSREEFESKRELSEDCILAFNQANDLVFNYGTDSIKPGIYSLDIRTSNTSGSKLFRDMLRLDVKEPRPYLLMPGRYNFGEDFPFLYSVSLEKTGSERENLNIRIQEKDGTIVPLDSLQYTSDSYSFKNVFHFSQLHSADHGTDIDIPFPVPYVPDNIYRPVNVYRGIVLAANRYGYFKERVQKQDKDGNPVFDDKTGEPVMIERNVRKLRYGFQNLRFVISEPGEWVLTIKFDEW